MASIAFREGGWRMATGDTDFDTGVIMATLCMTSEAVDVDDVTLSAMTLDECDSVTFDFSHGNDGRVDLGASAVTKEAGRVDFEAGAASLTWASCAAATRSIAGALVHEKGASDDTTAIPIAWCDFGTPVAMNGQDFVVNWDAGATQDVMRWTFS